MPETIEPEQANATAFKLSVRNFGPIAKADVELRPLSVLVGPNHAGKSYLATLIYALHRTYSKKMLYGSQDGLISQFRNTSFLRWSTETTDGILFNWLDGLSAKPTPERVKNSFHEIIHPVLATYTKALGMEIQRCFGIKLSGLIRRKCAEGTTLILGRHEWRIDSQASPFETMISINKQSRLTPTFSENADNLDCDDELWSGLMQLIGEFHAVDEDRRVLWDKMHDLKALLSDIIDPGIPAFFGALTRPAFYLPANRAGAIEAYHVVTHSLIERSMQLQMQVGPIPKSPPVLGTSGLFTDFVKTLSGANRERLQANRDLADRFEANILGGAVVTDIPETGLPTYRYRPDGWKNCLHLANTSAMVSDLAPLAIYLRYFVQKGDLLIIEEPAAGLHRDLRAAFVRQLAAIVNAGIRVMVTTCDEWLLDELAKLTQPTDISADRNEDEAHTALTTEQIGVWSFGTRARSRGSVVTEIPLDARPGVFCVNHDEAAATGSS